jgi:hypothetical protein
MGRIRSLMEDRESVKEGGDMMGEVSYERAC